MKKFENYKILFLAHYAPDKNQIIPKEHIVYAKYHKKVYEIIKKNFKNSICSSDYSLILNPPKDIDFIFSLYNRMPFNNSEIFISSVAEFYKIPYLGASPNIRALAEDKHLAKMMAQHCDIPTANWEVFNVNDEITPVKFYPPYFVKPRFGAASKFINESSLCETWEEAKLQIKKLHSINIDAIVEEFIDGIYYTSPVLNNFNSPIYLPIVQELSSLKGNIASYEQKRKIMPGLIRKVNDNINLDKKIQSYSRKMFECIQPLDYTRFDYIVDKNGKIYFLEFNVCCNLGEHSTVSQAAIYKNISYEELLLNIIHSSFKRNKLDYDLSKQF